MLFSLLKKCYYFSGDYLLSCSLDQVCKCFQSLYYDYFKAMSHGAIFLATYNPILLLRDVNLANTRLHYILLMYSSHIKQSSLMDDLRFRLNFNLSKKNEIYHHS